MPITSTPGFDISSEILGQRRAERLEHLLRGVERNAADEMKLTGHGTSFA
jgi:hypothetical protein